MKKWWLVITVMVLAAGVRPAAAQTPRELGDTFFSILLDEGVVAAYDHVFTYSPIDEVNPDQVDELVSQTAHAMDVYGPPQAYELALEETLAPSITRMVYLLKHQEHFTVWEMFLYRSGEAWQVQNLQFNDEYDLLKSYR